MKVPSLRPRAANSHKGNFGRALIIAGSRGMTGAACLAAYSTVKSGAGLVSVAVPDGCVETVAAYNPCYMTVPIADDGLGQMRLRSPADEEGFIGLLQKSTSVGIGPGLGGGENICELVRIAYTQFTGPMVVDADGLNALSKILLSSVQPAGPRILTPHIGEFRRLVRDDTLSPADCYTHAPRVASENGVILVLKGNRTLVTDGVSQYENTTGNPGMATGGAGDVLTGVITGLLGQGYSPFEASVISVYAHGLAGDIALANEGCELSLDAESIAQSLGQAFATMY